MGSLAWLNLGSDPSAGTAAPADTSVNLPSNSGSVWDSIGSVFTYVPNWIATQIGQAENLVLVALITIAVLILAVAILIGFAPNVKHLLPHFV
jgi:hypothetical protein